MFLNHRLRDFINKQNKGGGSTTRTKSGFFMLLAVNFAIVLVLISGLAVNANAQSDVDPDILKELTYRYIGQEGNRVSAVVGEPGNSNVIYAGAASGGIFKSTDGGIH